jgi:hypothetical protein
LTINLLGSHTNKNKELESATAERIFDPHPNENWRISWILYGCTAAIVVDYSITIGMIIDCRGGQGDELFYALMLTFDVVAQASFIVTEVAKRRYLGDEERDWRKALFIFLAVNNFVLWGHSIADNVCRYEVDNGAIVGQQLWSFLDPLFGSTIVFFRILSGCLYISLAYYSHHDRVDARSGNYYHKRSEPSNLEDQALKSTNRKMLEFMMSGDLSKASGEHKMKMYQDKSVTYWYYSKVDDNQQRKRMRSLVGAVTAIPVVTILFVAYDALARHAGKEQETQLKYAVEVAANSVLIITIACVIVLFCYCYRTDREDPKCSLSCGRILSCVNQCWKDAIINVESIVFFIFTVTGVVFYGLLTGVEDEGDRAADILGILAIVVHAFFIFSTNFSENRLKLFGPSSKRHTRMAALLLVLFAVTLGSLVVDIEREHLDHDVHDKPYLRAFAPLIVDFRLHATILTYNVLSEFIDHGRQEQQLKKKFAKVSKPEEVKRCFFIPSCPRLTTVYWKCLDSSCKTPHIYCDHCFKNIITKVGCCPEVSSVQENFEEVTAQAVDDSICCVMSNCCPAKERSEPKTEVYWKCKSVCCSSVQGSSAHYYCDHCFKNVVIKVGSCPKFAHVNNSDSVV